MLGTRVLPTHSSPPLHWCVPYTGTGWMGHTVERRGSHPGGWAPHAAALLGHHKQDEVGGAHSGGPKCLLQGFLPPSVLRVPRQGQERGRGSPGKAAGDHSPLQTPAVTPSQNEGWDPVGDREPWPAGGAPSLRLSLPACGISGVAWQAARQAEPLRLPSPRARALWGGHTSLPGALPLRLPLTLCS